MLCLRSYSFLVSFQLLFKIRIEIIYVDFGVAPVKPVLLLYEGTIKMKAVFTHIKQRFSPKNIEEFKNSSAFFAKFMFGFYLLFSLFVLLYVYKFDYNKISIYCFTALLLFVPALFICALLSLMQGKEYRVISSLDDFKIVSIKYLKYILSVLSIPVFFVVVSIGFVFKIGLAVFVAIPFIFIFVLLFLVLRWIIIRTKF